MDSTPGVSDKLTVALYLHLRTMHPIVEVTVKYRTCGDYW